MIKWVWIKSKIWKRSWSIFIKSSIYLVCQHFVILQEAHISMYICVGWMKNLSDFNFLHIYTWLYFQRITCYSIVYSYEAGSFLQGRWSWITIIDRKNCLPHTCFTSQFFFKNSIGLGSTPKILFRYFLCPFTYNRQIDTFEILKMRCLQRFGHMSF